MVYRAKHCQAQLSIEPELVRLASHLGHAARHPWVLLPARTYCTRIPYPWSLVVGLRQERYPVSAVLAPRRVRLLAVAQDKADAVEPRTLR
ncbi:hypothetical protein D9M68_1003300 [compost metagenome]